MHRLVLFMALASLTTAAVGPDARSDEGMWLYDQPPRELLQSRHNFAPTEAWLDHLRLSSVRFNSGGSGSFVSSSGLVMTNHHVGADAIQKLSTQQRDLLQAGFYATKQSDEIRCVDLELNVLVAITDVTASVNAAVLPNMSASESQLARRAVMNTIEQETHDKSGLRSDVVTLYQGGQYHLYQFRRYTDVRLVFAPEQSIAFFGGDPDNFEFPRFCLDVCFFRVYENDEPAKIQHFLSWSQQGAQANELVFVSGHPGRTSRSLTSSHLQMLRDVSIPSQLDLLRRREVLYSTYSQRSLENARRAKDELFGVQNSRKARLGGLAGLQDPSVVKAKQDAEQSLQQWVQENPRHNTECGTAWKDIESTLKVLRDVRDEYNLLEPGTAFQTTLFQIARTLVRMAAEDAKTNSNRLREFAQAGRESLEQELFSTAPIYPDLETLKLADSLAMFVEQTKYQHPLTSAILAEKSPRQRAAELVAKTTLADVAVRKELANGGQAAIDASTDPMIRLAVAVDARSRELRTVVEQQVEEPQRQAYAKIAQARFSAYGTSVYPDATFTLRLAFGVVAGYTDGTEKIEPWTTLGGAFHHAESHESQEPFRLPNRWIERREKIRADVPFNFLSTLDIIGGNSGSPVVNRKGEVVGLIFDGNLPSLVLDFAYSDEQARALSVDSRAIKECLTAIYDASELADELGR